MVMTTEIMKQNIIKSILDLEADNPYKKQLLEIMENHDKGKLTDIESYLLINDILVKYDSNVLIPKEQKAIEETRKSETEKTYGLSPNVTIFNPEDATEVAVKTKTEIGQIFIKGRKELIRTIGVENLNMKDREGNLITDLITDLQKISKGKRKGEADEIINQYYDIQNRPDLKQYAIQIADIFEIPHYIEKEDGRGKNGFYIENIKPIMIYYLLQKDENVIYTSVEELACFVGLVTKNYKKISLKELAEINPRFTAAMLNQFYYRCKPELESVIFRVLDSLQDEYKTLNYYRNYCISINNGDCHTSTKNEDIIIRQTERKVLKEFNAKRILTIFQRKQQKKFYDRVCEQINETYGFNWVRYKKQIQIFADNEALQEIMNALTNEDMIHKKKEISSRFARRIMNRTKNEYDRTNKKADEVETKWVQEQLKQPEIKELAQLGFDYEDDFREMFQSFSDEYRYHDNYLDVQNRLISIMIGEPEMDSKNDIPELKGIM